MLEAASFGVSCVLTAEDEHADGRRHARENVIHEAGLSARLGFSKAILLVEDGCEIPSNLHGLTHLGFPKNCIRATFADVLAVLDKEVGQRPTGVK